MSAESRIYLVEADYLKHDGASVWTWRRRYFSKQAALRQAERRLIGWTYEATSWDDEDIVQEPAVEVRVIPSHPVTFPEADQ